MKKAVHSLNQEKLHPLQVERFRKMSFEQKWEIAVGMEKMAREIRTNAWKRRHPDWTSEQVADAVAREVMRSVT